MLAKLTVAVTTTAAELPRVAVNSISADKSRLAWDVVLPGCMCCPHVALMGNVCHLLHHSLTYLAEETYLACLEQMLLPLTGEQGSGDHPWGRLSLPAQPCLSTALQKNHLAGLQRKLLRVSFWNVQQLMDVKREVQPLVQRNQGKGSATDAYAAFARQEQSSTVRMQVSEPVREI